MTKPSKPWLVFIDTNVFLDFYRLSGETALRQLAALKRHASRLILTEQVHMEFLKHRQRVVMATMAELKKPTEQKLPPVLDTYQPGQTFKRQIKDAVGTYTKLKEKSSNIVLHPEKHDEVFKALRALFSENRNIIFTEKHQKSYRSGQEHASGSRWVIPLGRHPTHQWGTR